MPELYKKYRPKTLDRIVGNEGTRQALAKMIEKGAVPHTLLFCGPSGCGKTTLARIVSASLNCSELDFSEINSSTFRGIDTIRDIQKVMRLAPQMGSVRIWLLDEVHKMSNDAQNGMLKMLEDTPLHVFFLLCTTSPEKLIKAIQTRCCEMPVRLLMFDELETLCKWVCKKEGITLSAAVQEELVSSAQGSARSLLVLLDKIQHLDDKDRVAAIQAKLADENQAIDLCRCLIKKESWSKVSAILRNLKADPEQVRWAVLGYARQVLLKSGDWQAYNVIKCFESHFYDSKDAGLVAAAYEAVNMKS